MTFVNGEDGSEVGCRALIMTYWWGGSGAALDVDGKKREM